MAQIAADILSIIPPETIVLLGLDVQHTLIRDTVEVEDFRRLSSAIKTRDFKKLRYIRVRLEYDPARHDSDLKEAVRILRDVFPRKVLRVETLPFERRHAVRDVTDDCYWSGR